MKENPIILVIIVWLLVSLIIKATQKAMVYPLDYQLHCQWLKLP